MTTRIVLACVECGRVTHAPLNLDPAKLFQETEYILSLVQTPDLEPGDSLLAPLCKACAERLYPDELRRAAARALLRGFS